MSYIYLFIHTSVNVINQFVDFFLSSAFFSFVELTLLPLPITCKTMMLYLGLWIYIIWGYPGERKLEIQSWRRFCIFLCSSFVPFWDCLLFVTELWIALGASFENRFCICWLDFLFADWIYGCWLDFVFAESIYFCRLDFVVPASIYFCWLDFAFADSIFFPDTSSFLLIRFTFDDSILYLLIQFSLANSMLHLLTRSGSPGYHRAPRSLKKNGLSQSPVILWCSTWACESILFGVTPIR